MHRQRFHSPDSSPAQPTGFLTIPSPNEFANGKFQGGIVATSRDAIAGRGLGGRPLRPRREIASMAPGRTADLHRNGWAIADRFLGGRPLRRHREGVSMSATGGCEGPQPSGSSWITVDEGLARASCDSPDDEFIHFRMRDGLCAVPFFSLL
jgi:hypothetical protein